MSDQSKPKSMKSVEEALDIILSFAELLPPHQVDMLDAAGRVLAQDVISDINISPFDNSAMDGFAVIAADADNASLENPVRLAIVGATRAGEVFEGTMQRGEAVRIMTGAPLPDGADTVIKLEDVEVKGESQKTPGGEILILTQKTRQGKNVRLKAEEAYEGQVLLTAGTVVSSAGVGLLAATGSTTVAVYRRARVAILSTGDELVDPSVKPGPGQIRNSNCFSLAAAVCAAGAEPTIVGIVQDDFEKIKAAVSAAAKDSDLVIISGGAAEGDFDYTNTVIEELGTVYFSKVNMRPGKAQTLGLVDGTIVFGLPGNPTAAMVGFEVLLRPALRLMQGYTNLKRPVTLARLTADMKKPDVRRCYIRAHMEHDLATGEYLVIPEKNQSSALLGALQNANCLVVLPEGLTGSIKDETVACLRLDINEGVVI